MYYSYLVCPLAVKFSSNSIKIVSKKNGNSAKKSPTHWHLTHVIHTLFMNKTERQQANKKKNYTEL